MLMPNQGPFALPGPQLNSYNTPQMNQFNPQGVQGFSNPHLAMAGTALQNMMNMRRGGMAQDPFAAAQQAQFQNAQLMQRRAALLDQQRQEDARIDILRRNADPAYDYKTLVDQGLIDPEKTPFMDYYRSKSTNRTPSSVMEWEYFSSLPEAQQNKYLEMKRAQQLMDMGGGLQGRVVGNTVSPVLPAGMTPSSARADFADAEAGLAGLEAQASEQGKAMGEKLSTASDDLNNVNNAIALVDKAIAHPGREAATGFSSLGNFIARPGSDRADYLTLAGQLKGQAFLEAYQSLKGGGQITEIEGKKAEQAQARLNEAQSESEYLSALEEMKALLEQRRTKIESYSSQDSDGWTIEPLED